MADIILYNTGKCEAVSFIETDSLLGFKSDGSVCASEIIETDSGQVGTGKVFIFREIIER